MAILDAEQVRAQVHVALAEANVRGVQLLPLDRRKSIEVLVRRPDARAAHAALDRLPWRWRYGGDGIWRMVPRRVYRFDGGPLVVLHRAVPCAPWPPGSLRGLRGGLLGSAKGEPGLWEAPPAAALTFAAVEAARDRFRSKGRLDALADLASATPDKDAAVVFARRAGVAPLLHAALSAAAGGQIAAPSPRGPFWGRACRAALRRLPAGAGALADARPVGHAIVRSRAGGLEVLAGPGVFLPRAVGDGLMEEVAAHIELGSARIVVEAGASCGGQLLPLVLRRPGIRAVGTELDATAVRWARRNAKRLGLPATFLTGSLLDPVPADLLGRVDVVFANLPSIRATDFESNADAPDAAYVGAGDDGLGLHREMARDARRWLAPGGMLVLQMAGWQWERFAPELAELGYEPEANPRDEGVAVIGAASRP